ncbi:MAG: hypothetical protein ACRDIY_01955 [Chloroflexota bacterium]
MHHAGIVILGLFLLILVLSFGPGVAVLAVLGVVATAGALVAGIWTVDYCSLDARAERAIKRGRVGQAIHLYTRSRTTGQLDGLLAATLSRWDHARRAVYAAAVEVMELERAIHAARAIGVSRAIVDSLTSETRTSGEVIWRVADRLGAAEAQGVDSEAIQQTVEGEAVTLDHLAGALHAARTGLAELTLRGGRDPDLARELRAAEIRLRALGDAARDVASLDER